MWSQEPTDLRLQLGGADVSVSPRQPVLSFTPYPGVAKTALGQSDPDEMRQVLGEEILAPRVAVHQIKS